MITPRNHSAAIARMAASRLPAPAPVIVKPEPEPRDPREALLLPCFRCQRPAEIRRIPGDWGYTPNMVCVGCADCGLWSPQQNCENSPWNKRPGKYDCEVEAVKAATVWWNKREPRKNDLVEAIEGLLPFVESANYGGADILTAIEEARAAVAACSAGKDKREVTT